VSRRPRISGTTRKRRTLFVLPTIPDGLSPALKNALAIRNACAVEGRCPCCGVVAEVERDSELDYLRHLTFRHEPWCECLRDEGVA
jgi:hypothetical protein